MESALNRPHVAVTSTMQGDEMQGLCIFHSFLSICCGLTISRLEIQACSSRKHTKLYAASTIPKRVAEELWPKKGTYS